MFLHLSCVSFFYGEDRREIECVEIDTEYEQRIKLLNGKKRTGSASKIKIKVIRYDWYRYFMHSAPISRKYFKRNVKQGLPSYFTTSLLVRWVSRSTAVENKSRIERFVWLKAKHPRERIPNLCFVLPFIRFIEIELISFQMENQFKLFGMPWTAYRNFQQRI